MNKYDTHLRTKLVVGKWLWSQLLATRGHLGDSAFSLVYTQFGIVASNYQTSFFRVLFDNSQFEILKKRNVVVDQRNVLQTGNVGVTNTTAGNLRINAMSHWKRQSSDDERWFEESCDQFEI